LNIGAEGTYDTTHAHAPSVIKDGDIYKLWYSGHDGFHFRIIYTLSNDGDLNSKKIAITDSNNNQLYTEIERWDSHNEQANLWIKVPTVSSGTNTELYLYYDSDHSDNTTYIGDTGDSATQNVWDSNFVGVWHMAQDPNGDVADAIKDSTSNANHGTPAGGMTSADLVDGKVGKAIDFDGDDKITIADNPSFNISFITIEAIIKHAGSALYKSICSRDNSPASQRCWQFRKETSNKLNFIPFNDTTSGDITGDTNIADDIHHHVCGVWDGSNIYLYVDGFSDATPVSFAGTLRNTSTSLVIASDETYSHYFWYGLLDELRISNTSRSSAWIKATYYSNWDDFIIFSEGEPVDFVFTNPIPAHLSTVYGTTKQLYLTTTVSGSSPNYIYDADFYDGFDVQIGTTISGINSGNQAISNEYLNTPSGIDYSWYMIASSSGVEDTSPIYTFHNRFLASGTTEVNGALTSGINVRLYKRDTGELVGSSVSTTSGVFNIETQYNTEFYCVALSPYTDTNSLIYDFLEPD